MILIISSFSYLVCSAAHLIWGTQGTGSCLYLKTNPQNRTTGPLSYRGNYYQGEAFISAAAGSPERAASEAPATGVFLNFHTPPLPYFSHYRPTTTSNPSIAKPAHAGVPADKFKLPFAVNLTIFGFYRPIIQYSKLILDMFR